MAAPHDAMFHGIFSVPANTASELRAVLPPTVTSRLDLNQLTLVPSSFVDEDLRWRHSDTLFTAPLDGHDAYIYYLIEHQSTHDPLMAYRMLRYLTRIWDQHLRHHPKTRRLPAIIPLVIYQGPSPWTSTTQLLDIIDLDPASMHDLRTWLPHFQFLLDDLTHLDEPQLLQRDLTAEALIGLLLLKTARGNPHLIHDLRRWAPDLQAILDKPDGIQTLILLLTYIEQVSDTNPADLRDLAASLGPDAEDALMTTADTLRAEGEARGRLEGEARGKARGKAEDILMVFEQRGIHVSDNSRELIESCTDLDTLNSWFRHALIADKATDLFER